MNPKRKNKNIRNNSSGITIISLVVTIIVLIILAGISINLALGDNGIITKAFEAKKQQKITSIIENIKLDLVSKQTEGELSLIELQVKGVLNKYGTINYENDLITIKSITTKDGGYEIPFKDIWNDEIVESFNTEKKVNRPVLVSGMTPIKFTIPTEDTMGQVVKTNSNDTEWYEYETKKWANAQTKDGSMWVWIPRYAYKITGQTIDVKFLIGQTDKYYDEDGNIKTAQRQTKVDEIIDITSDYTVHPAFTDESKINFANGGWDSELTGIWVAKFEAGYASGNNDVEVKASNVNYSNKYSSVKDSEAGTEQETSLPARNWLDGIYGSTQTSIKYPVFQGTTYSMNYISNNDTYNIVRALTDSGNIYGFSNTNADSHLMKNSEWGAVAYLSKSIYGQNTEEIAVNNISLESGNRKRTEEAGRTGVDSVYAITGYTTAQTDKGQKTANISMVEEINNLSGNENVKGIYVWNQLTGQKASTTGTIYGIYDMSGGLAEKTAGYIANGNSNLKGQGKSMTYENNKLKKSSTKYTTVYPYSSPESTTSATAMKNNFESNNKIYGDAVRETVTSYEGTTTDELNKNSWNNDYSGYPQGTGVFFLRGARWSGSKSAGIFSFQSTSGSNCFWYGFRAVVVPNI